MSITKITATATGKELTAGAKGAAGNSTGADVKEAANALIADAAASETAVNELIDWTSKVDVVGDTRVASLADKALTVDGQVKMRREEGTATESARPVWIELDHLAAPTTAPTSATDYHGIDLFSDVAASAYSTDMSLAALYPFESKVHYSGSGDLGGAVAGFFEAANNGAGTVDYTVALRLWAKNRSTGHVNNMYGIKMSPPMNNGTIGTSYGIFLDNVAGATNNYAIYTQAGAVRLGDDVSVVGTVTATDDIFSNSATSSTDTTANRVLRVGDFGIGTGKSNSGVDLDAETIPRTFSGNGFTNAPTSGWYYIETKVHAGIYMEQWATGVEGSTAEKIYRRVKDGTWKAWREISTTAV